MLIKRIFENLNLQPGLTDICLDLYIMNEYIDLLKSQIIASILSCAAIVSGTMFIHILPSSNPATTGERRFLDAEGEKVNTATSFPFRQTMTMLQYMKAEYAKGNKFNSIDVTIYSRDSFDIQFSWKQSVIDSFERFVPVKDRGSYLPWYDPRVTYKFPE
jgi:hypothetical protein